MKARGKREAQRNASPLVTKNKFERSTESAKYHGSYFALSELHDHYALYQGRRASRLFGACPWLSYSAPLALDCVRRLPWLSYSAPLALHCVRRLPWLSYSAPLALASEFKASSVSSFAYTACYILSPCSRVGLNETWQQSRDVRRPSAFI